MKSQKNVDNVRCGDKRRVRALLAAAAASVMLFLLFGEGGWLGRRSLSDRGIPDAVSSRTVNGECYLDVVANTDRIEDEAEFARTVVQMCRDNSFHSMKLSTDRGGYPSSLEIKVYLRRADINTVQPAFVIRYEPAEGMRREPHNIKDDVEKYKLYVDDKEIPCYIIIDKVF